MIANFTRRGVKFQSVRYSNCGTVLLLLKLFDNFNNVCCISISDINNIIAHYRKKT